jgi:Na+/H+ antiporter NhaD/arsenite permease-like protein
LGLLIEELNVQWVFDGVLGVNIAIFAIFILTYVLIASRRLSLVPIGRPAGALLGAVLLVLIGALKPEETYRAIDHDTILLLFATMGITASLERVGFFEWLAQIIIVWCKTPMAFLMATGLLSGTLSAIMVNDTVCLFLTPIILSTCIRAKLPIGPYLIALATSANIGSAATLVGNPQNMIIGSYSGFPFAKFLLYAGPSAGIGLLINMLLLRWYYRRRLPNRMPEMQMEISQLDVRKLMMTLLITTGVVIGFFFGFHMGYTALTGLMVLILTNRKEPKEIFSKIDWPLLLFFSCLFIVVTGLSKTGIIERGWQASVPYLGYSEASGLLLFTALMTIGSNLISNVPMVLMTGPHLGMLGSLDKGWILLAFTTTVAGNFTLIGSVANIIVAETARERYSLGFFEYLRFGIVSTILVLGIGVTIIHLIMI